MKVQQRLVELLVVLAIIFVVVAILLPPSTSRRDPFRDLSPAERKVAEEIERRGTLHIYLASPTIIDFRVAGHPEVVTDQTLENLQSRIGSELTIAAANMKQCLGLTLGHTQVTDAGLAFLMDWNMLRRLDLSEGTTDAGMARVAEMTQLEDLDLVWTQVTDAGIPRLSRLRNLRSLKLPWNVTDVGLAEVATFGELEYLSIWGNCTDDGLKSISGLSKLQHLSICTSHITDTGLNHTRSLSQLTELGLTGTAVTDDGARRLLIANPKLTVYLMGGPGPARVFRGDKAVTRGAI